MKVRLLPACSPSQLRLCFTAPVLTPLDHAVPVGGHQEGARRGPAQRPRPRGGASVPPLHGRRCVLTCRSSYSSQPQNSHFHDVRSTAVPGSRSCRRRSFRRSSRTAARASRRVRPSLSSTWPSPSFSSLELIILVTFSLLQPSRPTVSPRRPSSSAATTRRSASTSAGSPRSRSCARTVRPRPHHLSTRFKASRR